MNSKLFLMAVAVIAAFGIVVAAVGSPLTIATPAVALLAGRDNATVMAGNMTAGGNMTGGNWTK